MERLIKLTDDDLLIVADALRDSRMSAVSQIRSTELEEYFRSRIETAPPTAADRGKELANLGVIDLPPLAMNFMVWMCSPGKTSYDDINNALTIYAECVESLEGSLATDEHREWFDKQEVPNVKLQQISYFVDRWDPKARALIVASGEEVTP